MKSFYYPLYNQDFTFENIFSTESISPPIFYRERGYGIEYWPKLLPQQIDTAIVLYDEPPLFDVPKAFGETIKFILQINESAVDKRKLFEVNSGVSCYFSTIYLNKENFKILFFSERDKRLIISRSQQSLPTKDIGKYLRNFDLVSDQDCQAYNSQQLADLYFELNVGDLEFDRKFNFYKGLLYGLSAGYLTSSVPQELVLKKRLREIRNRFAELKNRIENQNSQLFFGKTKDQSSGVTLLVRELDNLIEQTKNIFVSHFPNQSASKDQLAKFLYEVYPNLITSKEYAQQYIEFTLLSDLIHERSDVIKIEDMYYASIATKPVSHTFRSLMILLKDYVYSAGKSSSKKERLDFGFKDNLSIIEKFLDQEIEKRSITSDIDLSSIEYDIDSNTVNLGSDILQLGKAGTQEFEILLNILIKHPKLGKELPLKESILEIIEEASFNLNGIKNSLLDKYYNNEVSTYSLDDSSSTVVKNFVAFVFNCDSIEKLASFNQAKNIERQWVSYTFWCAFNGFADVSGNFVRPIFSIESSLQDSIDNSLSKYLLQDYGRIQTKAFSKKTDTKRIHRKNTSSKPESHLRIFYDLYIKTHYDIDFEIFQNLALIEDRDFFVDVLNNEFRISRKDGFKIANSLTEFLRSHQLFSE